MDLWPIWPSGHRRASLRGARYAPFPRNLGASTSFFVLGACVLQVVVLGVRLLLPDLESAVRPNEADFGGAAITANVTPVSDVSTAARVEMVSRGMTEASVYYGSTTDYGFRTPWMPIPKGGHLRTTIIGLHPNAITHLSVAARDEEGRVVSTNDLTVKTPLLPREVPLAYDATANELPSFNYLVLGLSFRGQRMGVALMLDREGRVLWYRKIEHRVITVDRMSNGNFIAQATRQGEFDEIALDGTVVRHWGGHSSKIGASANDFLEAPSGKIFIIGQDTRTMDTRDVFPGGIELALRFDESVTELTKAGDTAWRWSTYPEIADSDVVVTAAEPFDPKDYQPANMTSIAVGDDEDVIVSLRDADTVVKIDRKTNGIAWRLGGKKNDFAFEGDPLNGPSRPADARILSDGHVLIFDGGGSREHPESRVVEYELDEQRRSARLVWEYRNSPPTFAPAGGSARRLPSGSTVIAWGTEGRVIEVDPESKIRWQLRLPGTVFRAIPTDVLYP